MVGVRSLRIHKAFFFFKLFDVKMVEEQKIDYANIQYYYLFSRGHPSNDQNSSKFLMRN